MGFPLQKAPGAPGPFSFNGKTMRVVQEFRRPSGELVAELVSVGGLLDLAERRLVADPSGRWRSAAREPELLGL